jgi:putative colanic acid biosynthesis acetyltransferase WcaF
MRQATTQTKIPQTTVPQTEVDLSAFDNKRDAHYQIGRSIPVQLAWFLFGLPLLRCPVLISSALRRKLLMWFGASIGEGVVVKPGVRVKFPWKLTVGRHCWIGEDCWIDNLAPVKLGDHVCLSQGSYLCTGSHDWSDRAFALITRPIEIQAGAWIAARASVAPGTVIGEHAVIGFGAVVSGVVPSYEIYAGNPAAFVRHREITADSRYRSTHSGAMGRDV